MTLQQHIFQFFHQRNFSTTRRTGVVKSKNLSLYTVFADEKLYGETGLLDEATVRILDARAKAMHQTPSEFVTKLIRNDLIQAM